MAEYSIKTSLSNGNVFETEANGGITEAFSIIVDNVDFSSKYELLNHFGWITPVSDESGLKLKINATREASTEDRKEREGYVTFIHLHDKEKQVVVFVKQKLQEYSVECENDELTFSSFPKDGNCEEKEVEFEVKGGSDRMMFKCVKQYGNDDKQKTYDNALKVVQEDNKLVIRSYGRIFMEEGEYYKVVVCHSEKRDVLKEITVRYDG